jgi:DNA uptake protein ComE-like DNA-binding protein
MQKNSWKEWFIFTKRERRAVIILLSLISLLVILPYVVPAKKLEIHIDKDLQAELDQYRQEHQSPDSQRLYNYPVTDTTASDTSKAELFFFDPNTLSEDGFVKLGLSQKAIHTLINYRNKGGYFKKPEDIAKIYGLSKGEVDRLTPYVRITPGKNQKDNEKKREQPDIMVQFHQYKKININTATNDDWKAFPGIGDAIANRIIKFRASVGGFKSVDQVSKTYGLTDSTFQFIRPYLYLTDSTSTTQQK